MATDAQLYSALTNADAAGDVDAARQLASEIKRRQVANAPAAAPPPEATMQDRAQAGAAGINKGFLSNLPGLPVDAALNVADLARAAYGTVGKATGFLQPNQMPDLLKRGDYPMSSEWLANKERSAGLGRVIDPNVPTDAISRGAHAFGQGGAAAMAFAPSAGVPNFIAGGASQLLPQIVAEHGGSPSLQTLASLSPLAGTAAAQMPKAAPKPLTPRDQAVRQAQDAGYTFPPSLVDQTGSSALNNALEKLGGKTATAQAASIKNQNVTIEAVKRDLGIPPDVPLTTDALAAVRRQAGNDYNAVKGAGTVQPGPAYDAAIDTIVSPLKKAAQGFPNAAPNPVIAEIESLRTPQFDAASGIEKISELRAAADTAYRAGDKMRGKALKDAATAIEDSLDAHLVTVGAPPDVLQNYRDARTLIAKTYTAQNAMNPVTGEINAVKLASALAKGRPLSGGMLEAARAASVAPSAMSAKPGAAGISKLDMSTAIASGVAALFHPAALLGTAASVGGSAARSAILSGPYQRRLAAPPRRWADLLPDNSAGLLGAYSAPARN